MPVKSKRLLVAVQYVLGWRVEGCVTIDIFPMAGTYTALYHGTNKTKQTKTEIKTCRTATSEIFCNFTGC